MVQGHEQLIDGVGSESVTDFRTIEGDANNAGALGPVIGDIG
jgi:hypothetical protein